MLEIEWRAAKKAKSVVMLFTNNTAKETSVTSRTTENNYLSQPLYIITRRYNQCKNAVDRADQCTVYYAFMYRCKVVAQGLLLAIIKVTSRQFLRAIQVNMQHHIIHLEYRIVKSLMHLQIVHIISQKDYHHATETISFQSNSTRFSDVTDRTGSLSLLLSSSSLSVIS